MILNQKQHFNDSESETQLQWTSLSPSETSCVGVAMMSSKSRVLKAIARSGCFWFELTWTIWKHMTKQFHWFEITWTMKTYDKTISPWDRLASTQQDSPAHLTRCFTMEVCSWGRKRQNQCGNAFEILSGVNLLLLLLVNCLTVCYRSKMQLHAITFGFGWLNFAESGLFENVPGIHRVMDKILPVLQSHLPEWLVLSIVCNWFWLPQRLLENSL